MINLGDMITIRGKAGKTGEVLEIKRNSRGEIGSYVVKQESKTSEIWGCNILEHTPSERVLKHQAHRLRTRDKRLAKRQDKRLAQLELNKLGVYTCENKISEIRTIIY